MTREEAIKVLEMFLYKQCDLERTKFAYDQLTVWDAVKIASEALKQPEIIHCKNCEHNESSSKAGNASCNKFYGMTDQMGFCHYGERRTDE